MQLTTSSAVTSSAPRTVREAMVHKVQRIYLSVKDISNMERIRKKEAIKQQEQPTHYKDKVVVKPWGYEFLMFKNDYVAIWFLNIKKGHATSMHCHPMKLTSLVLLSGKALCNTFYHRNFLSAGDALNMDAGVFHSTKSLSMNNISLIEIETPPDKVDLVRLEDSYGRTERGYEGKQEMVTENLKDFGYFYFDENTCRGAKTSADNGFPISFEVYPSKEAFKSSFVLDPGCIYGVCRGALFAPDKNIVINVGEIERGAYLKYLGRLDIDRETILIKMAVFS